MPASDVYTWAKASSKPSYAWSEISGKPSTFAPSSHSHTWSSITNKPSTYTPSSHTHDDRYYTETEVNNLLLNRPIYYRSEYVFTTQSNGNVQLRNTGGGHMNTSNRIVSATCVSHASSIYLTSPFSGTDGGWYATAKRYTDDQKIINTTITVSVIYF